MHGIAILFERLPLTATSDKRGCKHFVSEVTLLEDCFNGTKSILRNQFTLITDFDLSGPFMLPEADSDRKRYPLLHMYFVGERRAAYYIWNIALPNFLLSMLVFTSFAIPKEDLADRLSVTLTLVLTSVAFKYMVAQEWDCRCQNLETCYIDQYGMLTVHVLSHPGIRISSCKKLTRHLRIGKKKLSTIASLLPSFG